MPMKNLVYKEFDADGFDDYCDGLFKLMKWRPSMVVIHCTGVPSTTWDTTKFPSLKRLEFMSETWIKAKFKGAPHLVVTPQGRILVANPLTQAGTHSPSYNNIAFGIENVGNFNNEEMNPVQREATSRAAAALFRLMSKTADTRSLIPHCADVKTTHKSCPGSHIMDFDRWIKDVNGFIESYNHGDLPHGPSV
jgi:N-acetylmuramoyl-L-alanine amidase